MGSIAAAGDSARPAATAAPRKSRRVGWQSMVSLGWWSGGSSGRSYSDLVPPGEGKQRADRGTETGRRGTMFPGDRARCANSGGGRAIMAKKRSKSSKGGKSVSPLAEVLAELDRIKQDTSPAEVRLHADLARDAVIEVFR